jgi:predicted acetyltransferase
LWKAELGWETPHFGLGYRNADGRLTHFLWGKTKGESGPYRVSFLCYRDTDELMELLGLLRSIGDQVRAVDMMEPAEIQIQDLVKHPNRQRIVTRTTDYQVGGRVHAWWQARILDLESCIAARSWQREPIHFNLELSDPISELAGDWNGVGGTYVLDIAAGSQAQPGQDASAPTLVASVNAFSRLWLGARTATSLSLTTDLAGPPDLLAALDEAFRLPTPHTGMYL